MKKKISEVCSSMRASKHRQHLKFLFSPFILVQNCEHSARCCCKVAFIAGVTAYSAMFPVGKSSCCDVRLTD